MPPSSPPCTPSSESGAGGRCHLAKPLRGWGGGLPAGTVSTPSVPPLWAALSTPPSVPPARLTCRRLPLLEVHCAVWPHKIVAAVYAPLSPSGHVLCADQMDAPEKLRRAGSWLARLGIGGGGACPLAGWSVAQLQRHVRATQRRAQKTGASAGRPVLQGAEATAALLPCAAGSARCITLAPPPPRPCRPVQPAAGAVDGDGHSGADERDGRAAAAAGLAAEHCAADAAATGAGPTHCCPGLAWRHGAPGCAVSRRPPADRRACLACCCCRAPTATMRWCCWMATWCLWTCGSWSTGPPAGSARCRTCRRAACWCCPASSCRPRARRRRRGRPRAARTRTWQRCSSR